MISEEKQHQKDTLRIETFSDGIFCVAITLLAIEIGVEANERSTNQELLHALISKWPICLAYVISFINVLLAWIGHHSLFKNLRNTDGFVMTSNGLLLMLVALVPFPTKTLGLYFQTGAFKTAVIFYTAYFVLISFAFRLLWYAVSRNRDLLVHGLSISAIKNITKNENVGLVCNSCIFLVSFVNPWAALVLSFCMWAYWIFFS
jgi:uncharacterized membrane protein